MSDRIVQTVGLTADFAGEVDQMVRFNPPQDVEMTTSRRDLAGEVTHFTSSPQGGMVEIEVLPSSEWAKNIDDKIQQALEDDGGDLSGYIFDGSWTEPDGRSWSHENTTVAIANRGSSYEENDVGNKVYTFNCGKISYSGN